MIKTPTQLPDDGQLEKLVATAFDALPQADSHRLAVIEKQLIEKMAPRRYGKRSALWIWLVVGAMLAGTATATWWVGDYNFVEKSDTEQTVLPVEKVLEDSVDSGKNTKQPPVADAESVEYESEASEHNSKQRKRPKVIYRRQIY